MASVRVVGRDSRTRPERDGYDPGAVGRSRSAAWVGRPVHVDFLRDGGHQTRQSQLAGGSSPGHSLLRSTPPRPRSRKGASPAATPSSPNPDLANCGWRLPSSGQPRWGALFPTCRIAAQSGIRWAVGRPTETIDADDCCSAGPSRRNVRATIGNQIMHLTLEQLRAAERGEAVRIEAGGKKFVLLSQGVYEDSLDYSPTI